MDKARLMGTKVVPSFGMPSLPSFAPNKNRMAQASSCAHASASRCIMMASLHSDSMTCFVVYSWGSCAIFADIRGHLQSTISHKLEMSEEVHGGRIFTGSLTICVCKNLFVKIS